MKCLVTMRRTTLAGALVTLLAGSIGCGTFLPVPDDVDKQAAAPTEPESNASSGTERVLTPTDPSTTGVDAGTDTSSAPRKRVVFVTSIVFSAKEVGGIEAADRMCTDLANATDGQLQTRPFVAWLSDDASDVRDRLLQQDGAFVRVDGTAVAPSWEALKTKPLLRAIDLDENGVPHSGRVWTGTSAHGVAFGASCGGWTSESGTGHYGIIGLDQPTWSQESPQACTSRARLYCIEK